MTNSARQIIEILKSREYSAYSLQCGYAVYQPSGARFSFEPGTLEELERRNKTGRVIHAVYRYQDGSRLKFTWSELTGASLKELPRH